MLSIKHDLVGGLWSAHVRRLKIVFLPRASHKIDPYNMKEGDTCCYKAQQKIASTAV